MIRTYKEAVKFLEKYIPTSEKKYPGKLGLERMEYLVKLLGNPQNSLRTIHVGGTSGKGSTATIIAFLLATKYKVGLHTSPHLEKVNERIKIVSSIKYQVSSIKKERRINFSDIADSEFIELVNEIGPAVERTEKSKLGAPSYFEILTAMAFLYYKEQEVDWGVIEVGMGGRFDATNVILPKVSVITNVGLDHTEVLGKTVEAIARDKAGIIKPEASVVTGVKQKSVIRIIEEVSHKRKVISNMLGEEFGYKLKKITDKGSYFDYWGKKNFNGLFIPLLGEHQVENATTAIRAIEEGGELEEEEIRSGLKQVYIPGRLEIVRRNPLVILDGAHNPDKIKALVKAIKTIWPEKKVILVLAIKKGKDAGEMIKLLTKISKLVLLTSYEILADQGRINSYNPEKLNKIFLKEGYRGKMEIELDAKRAYERATESVGKDDLILVTGSLYLLGKLKVL
ncbi:hypothetical protein A3I51_02875 [Candidatus Gottesmanbacteria bacterium RIFCSPLOWO2_02_FULL_38_8]|uniref:tetrahydrofolate synthase n=1 Tax=Candidatus Gottesmanbacteria bacterium RIFCSPLOWO2_02_FULL_38_8 TaxID=1798397 RepID=A0A1F6B5R4_9BACT|nr:MAG: hypothetical protein A3I51_02875 [Candidatus Gottesmanbacteria bacterium RIFCSPLOWO2_02_FULL_38_8]